jgi:hypothetical protein
MSRKELMRKVGVAPFVCPKCHGQESFCGSREGLLEQFLLPALMVQPIRCTACDHRSYRFPLSLKDAVNDALLTDATRQPATALLRR